MSKAATVQSHSYLHDINTKTWSNGRHMVRCVKVIEETADVKTFRFMAEQPVMFFFKPGQFVTLELEIETQQVMRSYTISSSPSVPYSFSVTIKVGEPKLKMRRLCRSFRSNLKILWGMSYL